MIIDSKIQPPTKQTGLQTQQEQLFNWRECWYSICFVQDFPDNRPYSFSVYDEPFVMFRDAQEQLVCLTDRCSHRAAKLSDGQIIDGKIECLYHGWQFGSEGQCLHIPQLPKDAKFPANACVKSFKVVTKQGLIWLWLGEWQNADPERIPTIPSLDKPGFINYDKMTDIPCDIGYVIEHMLDPAHIHITHHGKQGDRQKAQPLEMEIIEFSVEGFRGRSRDTKLPNDTWKNFDFVVPSLVHLHFPIPEKGGFFGQAFFLFPLGKGRTRILSRSYRNFVTWPIKLSPRWWIHLKQNKILAQDVSILLGQQAEVERSQQNIKQLYSPLTTCDTFAIGYRQWLDKFGASLPYYRGYTTTNVSESIVGPELVDRKLRHRELCISCNRAYQLTQRLQKIFLGIAIALALVAIIIDGFYKLPLVAIDLLAVALVVITQKLKTEFELS